jgi:cytochrome c peroxidase
MKTYKVMVCAATCAMLSLGALCAGAEELKSIEQLGKALLFDASLSTPPGQSCAACHAPGVGFTGPDSAINAGQAVYPGAVHARAGNRKPPTAARALCSTLMKPRVCG